MDIADYRYMDSLFLDNYKKMDSRMQEETSELTVLVEKNAVVLPYRAEKKQAGVVNEAGEYIPLSGFQAISEVDSWGGSYTFQEEPYIDESVIYFGRFWKHWGHFLMDMVSRMWYVLQNENDMKIVYDATVKMEGVYLDFMKLLGIPEERLLRIDQPTRFKQVVIPECSHKPGISWNIQYRNIFDRVIANALAGGALAEKYKNKKIYFTRKHQEKRIPMEVGEKEIEQVFVTNGFLSIAPEQHTLAEQIAIVHSASTIACVSGTLPHNMVFAHAGEILIVIRKTNKPNYRQVEVNEMRELKVINVDAHISPKPAGPTGPFVLDFNQNMRRFCDDHNMKYHYSGPKQWIRRKAKMLWYVPVWWKRNHGKGHRVPVYDGKGFTSVKGAETQLRRFYRKRV